MQYEEQKRIVEALLFATPEPLTQQQITMVFETYPPDLSEIIADLREEYETQQHAFKILDIAGGYQLASRSEYETWIRRLLTKSGRLILSQAALETVSIIAYKQPISRVEIESIRGVDCSAVLKNLLSKNLIRIRGRDEGPGRPLLYGTTDRFLEYFGLDKLSDMPKLAEINELADANPDQVDAFPGLEIDLAEIEENDLGDNDENESDQVRNDSEE